jgi:hypothetical protein
MHSSQLRATEASRGVQKAEQQRKIKGKNKGKARASR